jgi:hypothetical protein
MAAAETGDYVAVNDVVRDRTNTGKDSLSNAMGSKSSSPP